MQHVTECIDTAKGPLFATYKYNAEAKVSSGSLTLSNISILTDGIFSATYHELSSPTIIVSTTTGVSFHNLDLSVQRSFSLPGPVFKHCLYENMLFAASSSGTYYAIDIDKEEIFSHRMACTNSSLCIHEIWSVFSDATYLYLGCDLGTLSVIDRKSKAHKEYSFQTGVTWIDKAHILDFLMVGTYSGEYCFFPQSAPFQLDSLSISKSNGTLWKVYSITYRNKRMYIVAQAYDGIGVYTEKMLLIKHVPTTDLVYSLLIIQQGLSLKVLGYTYYQGIEVGLDLSEVC